MRIYSMTATFGKLENQTLTLEPGLNILHAPNEWGKSTWCAFLVTMLYGIDTRERSRQQSLADKERYAPWSGSPMSGRMALNWNGRDITIERSTKGRTPMGVFRAYETATGLDIPELTADNCGQQLLGVEKSVFARAGFLRLSDLPVTQDENLRKRLNALVTTGDESGTADALAQKLNDLKNKCYVNRSKGLLPQAQAQKEALQQKLSQLQQLREESSHIRQQQADTEQQLHLLENHKLALNAAADRTRAEKLTAAQTACTAAQLRAEQAEQLCAQLPPAEKLEQDLARLSGLREQQDALHLEAQMQPQPPVKPDVPRPFLGLSPEEALSQASTDAKAYGVKSVSPALLIPAGILALTGIVLMALLDTLGLILGAVALLAGIAVAALWFMRSSKAKTAAELLAQKYAPLSHDQWEAAAQKYAKEQESYARAMQAHDDRRQQYLARHTALEQQLAALTGGRSPAQCRQDWQQALDNYRMLGDARRELQRAQDLVQGLSGNAAPVPQPEFSDELTWDVQQTDDLLRDCRFRQRQLLEQYARCQGSMLTLGNAETIQRELSLVEERIARLEDLYAAAVLAQEKLAQATAELQRRFAPRIARRAQETFSRLTGGRYDRLTLDQDLGINAGATDETTLHSAIWRSEGTIDQLYFALRLAVAEALTPEAPLVLDDAFARFDDTRLQAAMEILKEESEKRQILLFTCQTREEQYA